VRAGTMQRVLGRAIDAWRPRRLGRRLRSVASVDLLIGYGLLAAIVLAALCKFIATPIEPFGYTGDLGFSHETVAGAAYTIHSPIDAFDAIAWTPWFNFPLLYLNSNVSEAFLFVVTWLSGNAWLAIKIVQVFEVLVSVAAGFAMYATYSKQKSWALVFGFSYAAIPITALAIRGNLAMGWLAALAPAAIAAGTLLLRKFGGRAVPFIGFICGFVGYGIALEYAVFSSLPLFALTLAGERRRLRLIDWLTFVPLGLLCCMAMGAFYVLPTFVAPIISDAAARTATLVTGTFLHDFSQTWPGLLTLVTREAYVSPYPEYNAAAVMPTLYLFGAVLWFGAVTNLVWAKRRSTGWTDYLSVAIVVCCIVLAMGTAIPFGQELWNALFAVPHFNAIRTPDRFFTVPAMLLTFWFVCGLERVTQASVLRQRAGGWLAFTLIVAFICFDLSQHCFTLDPSKGSREPELDEVQRIVEAQGARTVSFAGVNGGASFESASGYGIPQPSTPAAVDLGWRFIEDGNGSAGVIGRTGVRTIIAAPNWTGALDFPNASAIYRHLPSAPVIFRSTEDVLVARVGARAAVSAQTPVCVSGGPGGFDLLDDVGELAHTAFLERSQADCRASGFVNFDPHDLWLQRPEIEVWAGSKLIVGGKKLRDVDYPFLPNRSLLNIPWYRNSIDGDRPLFDEAGAVEILQPAAFALPEHKDWPAGTLIAIRINSHVGGTLDAGTTASALGSLHIVAGRGFRWYEIRTTRAILAGEPVSFNMHPAASQEADGVWGGFALDGVAARTPAARERPRETQPAFVAMSLDRFERLQRAGDSDYVYTPVNARARAVATNMYADRIEETPAWLAASANAQLSIPWTGPTGEYVVEAQGVLTKPGDTIGIDATDNGECCRFAATNVGGSPGTVNASSLPSSVRGRFHLQEGSKIVVRLVSHASRGQVTNRLLAVSVKSVGPLALGVALSGALSGEIDFTKPDDALAQLAQVRGISFGSALAYGEAGSELRADATLGGHPRSVALEIIKAGLGSATATLACDGADAQVVPIRDDDTAVALSGNGFSRCSIRIHWSSGNLGVHLIRLTAGGGSLPAGTLNVWLPAGTYRASIVEADGTILRRPPLRTAGCASLEQTCTFQTAENHRVRLGETPGTARLLLFTSTERFASSRRAVFKKTAALRWDVSIERAATIALTQIYDGNWILTDGLHTYSGERCDITNTCFPNVRAGAYHLYHRWPRALAIGVAITLTSLLFAVLVMLVRFPQKRYT
jgi:hypothetical protein